MKHDDLAYTINDSGNAPIVFAIKISTGAVVGTTTITGNTPLDTEAIAIDGNGELWVADTGDNTRNAHGRRAVRPAGAGAGRALGRRRRATR